MEVRASYRDAPLMAIDEGTNDISRVLIACWPVRDRRRLVNDHPDG